MKKLKSYVFAIRIDKERETLCSCNPNWQRNGKFMQLQSYVIGKEIEKLCNCNMNFSWNRKVMQFRLELIKKMCAFAIRIDEEIEKLCNCD